MWSDHIVVAPPALVDDLGLPQRVENFAIEQFIAKACVETFDAVVLL